METKEEKAVVHIDQEHKRVKQRLQEFYDAIRGSTQEVTMPGKVTLGEDEEITVECLGFRVVGRPRFVVEGDDGFAEIRFQADVDEAPTTLLAFYLNWEGFVCSRPSYDKAYRVGDIANPYIKDRLIVQIATALRKSTLLKPIVSASSGEIFWAK